MTARASHERILTPMRCLQEVCEALKAERDRMYQELGKISFLEPYPSHANYILCNVVGRDAKQLKDSLAKEYGIMVRHYAKKELAGYIRISAGKPEQTDALLKALRDIEGFLDSKGTSMESEMPKQVESEGQPAGSFTG